LRLNTPGEFRLPSTCFAYILISFICSSVQRVVRSASHEKTHELLGLDEDPDESPKNSYAAIRAIYTRDFKTARRSHKTFVESADGASRYAPHSFWVTKWTVVRICFSLPLYLCGNCLPSGVRSTLDGCSCCIATLSSMIAVQTSPSSP
jgi:hypothetical protein